MNLKKISFALFLAGAFTIPGIAVAQDSEPAPAEAAPAAAAPVIDRFPPNAQPGRCYARVLVPAVYREDSEQVLISEASESIQVVPAQFEQVTERVLVRDASTRIETVPATFKTITEEVIDRPESVKLVPVEATYKEVTEQVLLKPASTRIETIPAEYAFETEQVVDKAAHTVWKRGSGLLENALETSVDRSTGEIMCLVEVPATYKTISRRVLVKAASTREFEVPAEYTTVTRTVVDRPAMIEEVVIPATYKTVTRQVIDQPASSRVVEVPAEYKNVSTVKQTSAPNEIRTSIPARFQTVTRRVKVADEELVWREVLCDVNITTEVISQLQTRLKATGDYVSKVDGILGRGTQRAVNKYADANGLPSGTNYIAMEVLTALGIDF